MAVTILALALALSDAPVAGPTPSALDAIPVEISEKLAHYEIKGDSSRELISQMAKLGPIDQSEGRHFQGNTTWAVRWGFGIVGLPSGGCRLDDIKIDLEVLMTLPEWTPKRHADQRLVQAWPHFIANLTGHEMGHRANGVRAAFAVRDAIAGIAPMADCQQLGAAANAAANLALNRLKEADVEYDRETDHGAKQGFQLP